MGKVFITTSRRPTTRTRSLLKDLASVIPNAVRIVRGHATLEKLALEAFDVGADRIVVLRNWKGNPKFVDFYEVLGPGEYRKLCTLTLKGFKLIKECGSQRPPCRPKALVLRRQVAVEEGMPLEVVECLVRGFHIEIRDWVAADDVELRIEIKSGYIEIAFRIQRLNVVGPVLRVWKAKLYPIAQS